MRDRPYMRLFTSDWRDGTRTLTFEERGFYMQILTYLHDGEQVPADTRALSLFLQCDPRMAQRLTDRLIAKGKIYVADGALRNRRIDRDLGETSPQSPGEVSEKSGRSPAEVSEKSAKTSTKSSVEKGHHFHSHIHIQKKNPRKPPKGASEIDCLTAFQEWNAMAERCGLQQAANLSAGRRRLICARLKSDGLDGWRKALDHVEKSSFLRGMTGERKWRATLDWTLKASNYDKLLDGQYGNGAHAEPKKSNLLILEELCRDLESVG